KKRRPDAEETYTPGLPVGVTEDDLEDDDEEESENITPGRPQPATISVSSEEPGEQDGQVDRTGVESEDASTQSHIVTPSHGRYGEPLSEEELERRKLARI